MSNTGCPGCGTHLHFNTYYTNTLVDPSSWFSDTVDPWEVSSGAVSSYLWGCSLTRSETVYGPTGGSITSAAGNTLINIPAGAYPDTLTFTIMDTPVANPPDHLTPTGYSFVLRAEDALGNLVTTFVTPLDFTINFNQDFLSDVNLDALSFYRGENASNQWQAIPTTISLTNQTANAQVDHLSYFALMGEPLNQIFLPIILK